ncbi:putative sulfatase [Wenyingzhuangia heitensis]|uniref:Sulfatase n=1 Tax=Wenyingzhuangia heitensis TaxID=1487859 RepID=A0ABX0U7S4_9FLAO|nr:sulfatase-like hydrolase/transferase [Wenyingzhuangia heitensis]NIJ44895.1 putative sulfatase [Wenyingzhuangia heitensis]
MKRLLYAFFLGVLLLSNLSTQAQKNKKPNIVWVITDEHNFRTLGCYRDLMEPEQAKQWGDKVVDTPNLDWLASNGAMFTSMYASSPVCSPSRSSMFTGQYPHTVNMSVNNNVIDKSYPTIANVLNKEGYKTGYVGKWHLSGESKPGWAPEASHGFVNNRYMFNRGHWKVFGMSNDGTPFIAVKNKKGEPSYGMAGANEKTYSTDWLMDRTIDFIDENKKDPFFCVVSLPEPHGPDAVRAPYDMMYKDNVFSMPRTFLEGRNEHSPKWRKLDKKVNNPKKMQDMIATYFGSVKCIDDNIGKLITSLKEKGILENTIIMFSSDHGDLLGEHNQVNKGAPFEGSALIPCIVYAKQTIKAGTVINTAVNNTDWMPTFLNMASVKNQPKFAGKDLSPLLKNPNLKSWDGVTFSRIHKSWVAVISDRYKLAIDVSSKSQPWLIDTKNDPDELINHYGEKQYKTIAVELAKKLKNYVITENDPFKDNAEFSKKLEQVLVYK